MKKILVTGVAGFIGYHLTHRLCENGYDVVGIDNLNDYYDVNLKVNRLKQLEPLTVAKLFKGIKRTNNRQIRYNSIADFFCIYPTDGIYRNHANFY
ncbi:MAG: NAD-dependent epimerase/dehydratase family protein [Bacteroidetes bacterium]|nr:NAD-dependent epimerase/dehydratase family protein [Bacteroidota bacterium]